MLRSAGGRSTVTIVRTRGGEVFKVHEPFRIPGGGSWMPMVRICLSVPELRDVICADAFATLHEV